MHTTGFEQTFGILPEPMLLIGLPGAIILAGNKAARDLLGPWNDRASLFDLVLGTREKLIRYLDLCARTRQFIPGRFLFNTAEQQGSIECRVEGARFDKNEEHSVLLRVVPNREATRRFESLNNRIEALNREIAVRRRAELQLRNEREWLKTTLASIGDAVIATDRAGDVMFMNAIAETLTGWMQAEANGQPVRRVFNVVHEEMRVRAESPVETVLRERRLVELANHSVLIRRDGAETPVAHCAAPIQSPQGEILGVALVFRDISERIKRETEIHETNRWLRRVNGDLRQFAYAFAHDLQEPLRMVNLYAQMLTSRYDHKLDDEGREFIRYAATGAKRAQALIDDLLAFILAGDTIEQPLEDVDASAVLSEALARLRREIAEADARITSDPLPRIKAHATPLILIFQNLVANSIKYRRPGIPPQIHVTARRERTHWVFTV